jgi:hypothetical protein
MARTRLLALGGAALVAAGGALFRRRRAQARLGSPAPAPSTAPEGARAAEPPAAPAPAIANADAAGPPENTSTAVPAPARETAAHEGQQAGVLDDTGGIDEDAEEAAAAAEARNIGGPAPEYVENDGSGDDIDEAERALIEGGGGESEGEELAELDLIENAEDDFDDKSDAERQLDETIEAQDDPFSGEGDVPGPERIDDLDAEQAEQAIGQEPDAVQDAERGRSAQDKSAAVWRTDDPLDQPTVEQPKVDPDAA